MSKKLDIDVDKIFTQIDLNQNGVLDRYEFLTFALMEYGMIDEKDLASIHEQFDDFDKDGNDKVTKEEVCAKYGKVWNSDVTEYYRDS